MKGSIILYELTLHLFVGSLLQFKLLLMEEIQYAIHGQEKIYNPKNQANNWLPSNGRSNLRIKYKLSCRSEHQRKIYQFYSFHAEFSINILYDTRFSEEIIFINPVKDTQSNNDENRSCGDNRAVKISKPNWLDNLCVTFSHTISRILHKIVCLALSVFFLATEAFPLC